MMVAWDDEQATAPIKWDDEQTQVKWDNEGVSASPTDLANQALKGTGITVGAPPNPNVAMRQVDPLTGKPVPQMSDAELHPERRGPAVGPAGGSGEAGGQLGAGYVMGGPVKLAKGLYHINEPGADLKQIAKGASETMQGAGTTMAPIVPAAAVEAPISTALGIGGGYLASKGVEAGLNKTNLSPEYKQAAKDAAWFLPSLLGTAAGFRAEPVDAEGVQGGTVSALGDRVMGGVASTPEGVKVGAKVGPLSGSFTVPGTRPAPEGPALEPPTIEGQEVPPTPDKVAEAAQAMARANAAENPQPVQAPPAPPPVSGAVVDAVAKEIAKAPPEQRDSLLAEAHARATESILHHGSAVVDGEVHPASNPAQTAKAAAKIINEAVEKADAESDLEQARRGASEAPKSEITNAVPPEQRASTQIVKDAQENAAGRVESRVAEKKAAEKPEVAGTPEGATRDTALFQQAKTELGPDASMSAVAQRAQELKGGQGGKAASIKQAFSHENLHNAVSDSMIDDAWKRLSSGKKLVFGGKPGTLDNRIQSAFDAGHVHSRDDVAALVNGSQQPKQPEPLAKGSKVTLPSGEPATVTYVHPKMSIVRYKTDGGENGSIAKSKLTQSVRTEPQGQNGSAPETIPEPISAPIQKSTSEPLNGTRTQAEAGTPSENGSTGPFTERDISRFNSFTHYPKDRAAENATFASESAAIEAAARERLKRGGVDEMPNDVREAIDSYNRARYEQSMAFTRAREVAPPWSVVGRSNYKGKPLKARAIERKAIEATEAAKARMERAIKQHGPSHVISSDAPDAIQQLQAKIKQAEKLHDVMKSANVIVRKSSLSDAQKIEELSKLDGLNEKRAAELLKPDFAGRKGFADYELTSSTTNIRRMNERIAELTRSRATAGNEVAFDGGKLIDNAEANRVQIKYSERPPLTTIQKLKSKGFRWAPSEGVWQRQRTDSARYDAEQLVGVKLPEPTIELEPRNVSGSGPGGERVKVETQPRPEGEKSLVEKRRDENVRLYESYKPPEGAPVRARPALSRTGKGWSVRDMVDGTSYGTIGTFEQAKEQADKTNLRHKGYLDADAKKAAYSLEKRADKWYVMRRGEVASDGYRIKSAADKAMTQRIASDLRVEDSRPAVSAPEPEPVATINGRTFEASTEPVTPKQEVAPGTETPTKLSELKRQLDELLDSKMPTEPKPRQEWVSKQRRLESAITDAESGARYSGIPETKPPDGVALPDAAKDLRAHQKAYFQESLKPVMAAWDKLIGKDGELHDQLIKGTQKPKGKPAEFQNDYIHIEVPQDGKFLIVNTPYAINRALKGSVQAFAAIKPQTFPNRNAAHRAPKEFDNERYIAGLKEEIAQLEKDVHNDARSDYAREQLKAARENLAEATQGDEGISFGLSVPGVAQAAEALGKAAGTEYDAEIKPFLEKTGLSLTKALTELQHLIAPRAGVPTATLDSAMKLTGQREKHRWYLEQTLSKAQAMFDKLSRDEQIAFIDAFKTGDKQPTPELQQIADFMGKTDDATYRQVIEAQIANMSKTAQKVWNRIGADKQDEFLDGIKDFEDEDKFKAFVKTLPSGVQLLKTAPDALKEIADGILHYKDNHYRVLWKTIPGSKGESGARGVMGRRPLQGSKGFLKQSTLNTMSEGLDRGGEPVSYNPVTMFQLAQADSWRYITAQRMWKDALDQKGRVFVKRGQRGPDGFKKLEEDRIGNVRFPAASGEGPIEAGNWYLMEDWHRLLSNMLSHDYIRESTIGSGLMAAKNQLTAYRLGLSPFHAFTTSFSSVGGQVGRGLGEINYALRSASVTHAVEGLKDIATAPIAPVSDYRLGTSLVRYATNKDEFLKTLRGQDFIKHYPEADALLDRLFSSGAKLSLHEDEKLKSIEGLRQAASENRWIAAVLKSPFALNQWVFRPLFGFYIPRLKLASFLKDYSQALVDHRPDIDSGRMTEGELGRKIWDSTENVYGQMNWDARWWDRTFKSAIQFTFRAFTWFAGNARLVKDAGLGQSREFFESAKWWGDRFGSDNANPSSGPIPRLDPNSAKLLGLALVWMGGNAALQYAMTHEKPKDAKDLMAARIGGVDPHGKARRVTIPIIAMHDAMSLWYGGLKSYMRNKLSDVLSGVYDVLTNEDFKHDMVHDPDASFWKQREQDATHILGAPIGISTTRSQMQRGATEHKAALSLAGISPAPSNYDYTPLEQKLSDILRAKHAPLTVEDQEQLGAKRERIAAGNATPKERITEFRYQRKGFVKSLATRPEITYPELSRAMADANAIEKHELMPVLAQKRLAVLKRGAVAQ